MKLLLTLMLLTSSAFVVPTESTSVTKAGTTDGSETDWTDPSNIKLCDSIFTDVLLVPLSNSSNLVGTGLTWTPPIPANATIVGISFELPRYLDMAIEGVFSTEFAWVLHDNGVNLAAFRIATIPIDDGDNQWTDGDCTGMLGYTLTPSQVNGGSFGFKFQFGNTDDKFNLQPAVDCVTIHACWTVPSGGSTLKLIGVG